VTAVGATAPATTLRRPAVDPGLPFVGFALDYLVIGGGFSLLVLALLQSGTMPSVSVFLKEHLWTFVLLSNSAHFAASTVRLYTRPGSFRELPFLTMGLPLASLLVLALGFVFPGALGQNLLSLYLTWSPYHYWPRRTASRSSTATARARRGTRVRSAGCAWPASPRSSTPSSPSRARGSRG